MIRKGFWGTLSPWLFVALGLFLGASSVSVAGPVNLGTVFRRLPNMSLPVLAAEENGYWSRKGLEVKWLPVRGGGALFRAVAGRSIDMGIPGALSTFQAIASGVPVVIVADLKLNNNYYLWVRADSTIKKGKDLKGAKFGVSRFGGEAHAYLRWITKALELEKDVKIMAVGGRMAGIASLKSGRTDGIMATIYSMAALKYRGEVKDVLAVNDLLPNKWLDLVMFARRDFAQANPDSTRNIIKGVSEATRFIEANPAWSIEKMKTLSKYPEEVAKAIYKFLDYGEDFSVDRAAVANVLKFLTEFGIIKKERTPSIDKLFTNKFVQ